MPSLALNILEAHARMARLVRNEMSEMVGFPDAMLLRMLALNKAVTVADVRLATGLPASTVSSMVRRLQQRGHLERHRLETDRRFMVIEATPIGKQMGGMVGTALADIYRHLGATFDPDDLAIVEEVAEALNRVWNPRIPSRLD
jgi:DNA-binding MarR family transcriptional regulator